MTQEPRPRQRMVFFLLKIILAAGVLWFVFTQISPQSVYDAFMSADLVSLGLAALLIPVQFVLRITRWAILLNASGEKVSWVDAAPAILVGHAFSAVTPADLGDYVARSRMHRTADPSKSLALTLLDKMIHGGLVILVGVPALLSLMFHSAMTGVLAIVTGLVLVVIVGLLRRPLLSLSVVERVARKVRFQVGLEAMRKISSRTLLRVALIGFGVLMTYVAQEYLLLNALADVSFVQTWQGFWAGISVRSMAPFFFGDLGIREATHVYFFGLLGVDAPVALSASLLMFALNVFFPTLLGLAVFLRTGGRRS